jgi:hypothetical protein
LRILNTATLSERNAGLNPDETSWVYNGLDCCVTLEVFHAIEPQLHSLTPSRVETYATAMRKVAPVLSMTTRGILRDPVETSRSLAELRRELAFLESRWNKLCLEVLECPVNWRSPLQLKNVFYGMFALTPVRKRDAKGNFSPTVNEDALERFCSYHFVQVFARLVLAMRKLGKKIGFLETEVDEDGRMRTSLNIAGTDTGRFSSKFSAFGTGTNLQNVENVLRRPFIADKNRIFVNVDLEQADARNVGARIYTIFCESHGPEAAGSFLDACESGDLHTRVTSMTWRDLPWLEPWDAKAARTVADLKFGTRDQATPGDTTYRDMSKKLGHGTNYYGMPKTMAGHTKTPIHIIEDFQRRYFAAFPLIGNYEKDLTKDDWHGWISRQLHDRGGLSNLFGRWRTFFGRAADPETLRAAIAYDPQSSTGEFLDRGWLSLYDNMPPVQLHIPVHDSILFSLPMTSDWPAMVNEALRLLRVEIELPLGRKYSIPLEAKVGWNWGDSVKDKKTGIWENPYGLRKWTGSEDREPPKRGWTLRDVLDR